MNMNGYDRDSLSANLILQLRNLVSDNQARAEDLQANTHDAEVFGVEMDVFWTFSGRESVSSVAGGSVSDNHFGKNRAAFEQHCQELLDQAAYDQQLRQAFLNHLETLERQALPESAQSSIFHDFGYYSVKENCSSCGGSGEVRCSSCGGRGSNSCSSCGGGGTRSEQVPQYGNNGRITHYRNVSRSCGGCGGSGRNTCGACSGRGRQECSSCKGHGYFIITSHITAVATPTYHINCRTKLAREHLEALLTDAGILFCHEKIPFFLQTSTATAANRHCLTYHGESIAIKQSFRLLKKDYLCYAFSNPPYPYLRPAIFDDLFADELNYLQSVFPQHGSINKRKAIQFFNRYAGQPALDTAMRNIARARTASNENTSDCVIQACQGFITKTMAEQLSSYLNKVMDKVSPAYAAKTWVTVGSLFCLSTLILAQDKMEFAHGRPWSTLFLSALAFVTVAAVLVILIPLVSALLVIWARRHVPHEYRQKMRHKEPCKRLLKWGLVAWLVGSAYGFVATKGWVPRWHGLPRSYLTAAPRALCSYLPKAERWEAFCSYVFSTAPQFAPNDENTPQKLANQTEVTDRAEQIRYVQIRLVAYGYPVTIDGKMGMHTRKYARQHLKKTLQISNPSDEDLYSHFKTLQQQGR